MGEMSTTWWGDTQTEIRQFSSLCKLMLEGLIPFIALDQ